MWSFRFLVAAAVAAGVVVAPSVEAQAGAQECPAVAVVAARGSDQNEFLEPTRYSAEAPWISNGYEERTIRAFLQYSEERHRANTGTSLMKDVYVLGLDASVYPAEFPSPQLTEKDEEVDNREFARRAVGAVKERPAHVMAYDATVGFAQSLRAGVRGTLGYIDAWEERTGCAPGYILIGYSQGALVLAPQEEALAERGQFIGSLYLGNPLLTPGDATVVGQPTRGGGLLSSLPQAVQPTQADVQRLNYCAADDFVCDVTSSAIGGSLTTKGGVHANYFLEIEENGASEYDAQVSDTFAGWITGYTSRP